MPKGYWVSMHWRPADPDKHATYREIAIPAIRAAGGKFLVIGGKSQAREFGLEQRTVVVEFPSHEAALNAYESEDYHRALATLGYGAERDVRIVKGVE
ncbi:MAG: DUF1330 domain-containing protein [Gammaproteobacteria bacterium]|jgi:uncharacterized protein (DUF1330 family)|nr:DUF1330 domain-containing protein [Gammaproteobacteria bacterium]